MKSPPIAVSVLAFAGLAVAAHAAPSMVDPLLRADTVASGFGTSIFDCSPGFVFVGHRVALVVNRVDGRVRRADVPAVGGAAAAPGATVLDLDIVSGTFGNSQSEWGVQAIARHPDFDQNRWVYIRYDLSPVAGTDTPQTAFNPFTNPNANVIDRFVWDDAANGGAGALVFDTRIFSTPLSTEYHHGGPIVFDADRRLITTYGELRNTFQFAVNVNNPGATQPWGVVLRLTDGGAAAPENPFTPALGAPAGFEHWMAYGIRNSFGLSIDPVTGDLWQSENGENRYDELNRITAGFNGGWLRIAGPTTHPQQTGSIANLAPMPGGMSFYREPVFSWFRTVGPTDVQVLHGSRLGPAWDNGLVAGNFNSGFVWLHRLNETRDGLVYTHPGLADRVDDRTNGTAEPVGTEAAELLWGRGFGALFAGALAVELGPDGRPYVLTTDGLLIRICRACPLDIDANGLLNPDDLGDFITAYYSPLPPVWCDYNDEGIINPDDLGDYITDYFGPVLAGC
ncbi:MAG: PQQ-dependent sugar dehydrogenase [Phycisphaerales bacterium]